MGLPSPARLQATIPFYTPYRSGHEVRYVMEAIESNHHHGDGSFTQRCHALLEARLNVAKALLTTSCTTSLEMAAILARGDTPIGERLEVIVPSYTFVSTVNAFLLHGYTPVFADIRLDTCNLDESKLERHITDKTRVVVPVHYAGVPCEMDVINQLAERHGLVVVEDAAQAIFATYKGRAAGCLGDIGCFSFHGTKNLSCGEGGAVTFRETRFVERAEFLREKGTNRKQFFRGEVDRYTWVDLGGSYLPSDILSAYLLAQLEAEAHVHELRQARYEQYQAGLKELEAAGQLLLPVIPDGVHSNHHLFHVILENLETRNRLIGHLKQHGVGAVFHYGALHLSPMGEGFGPPKGALPVAEHVAESLLRLPLYPGLSADDTDRVIDALVGFFRS